MAWPTFKSILESAALLTVIVGGISVLATYWSSQQNLNHEWSKLAISILQNREVADDDLREWAVEVLNNTAPVRLKPDLARRFISGKTRLPVPGEFNFWPDWPYVGPVGTFSRSGTTISWNKEKGEVRMPGGTAKIKSLMSLDLSPNTKLLAFIDSDEIYLYETATAKLRSQWRFVAPNPLYINFHGDESVWVRDEVDQIQYDLKGKEIQRRPRPG